MVYGCLHRYRKSSEERTHHGVMELPNEIYGSRGDAVHSRTGVQEPLPLKRGADGSNVKL